MRTNFKFFFNIILATTFLSVVLYGLAQRLVEQHVTAFSFSLLAIIVFGIAGMMRSIVAIPTVRVDGTMK
jgi:hypothetical protein